MADYLSQIKDLMGTHGGNPADAGYWAGQLEKTGSDFFGQNFANMTGQQFSGDIPTTLTGGSSGDSSSNAVFDLPTLTPDSATSTSTGTSGIDWDSAGVEGLLSQIQDWVGRASGLAQNSQANIGNFYNNMMRESLGPQAFQGTLNNLRERNMIDSSVASDALANAQTGIASNIGNRAFDTYLKGYDTQMQMPGMLSQMAQGLGGKSASSTTTDPMAAYRLIFGNYV